MEHDHNQSTDAEEPTTTNHSRRDMLKLASTVGAASLGATTLVETAAASEARSDPAAPAATGEKPVTAAAEQSDDVEALSVEPSCIMETGNPGVTIKSGACASDAYADSWDYAGYILDHYSGLDNCRTQVSVAAEIEAHWAGQNGESITIGCEIK